MCSTISQREESKYVIIWACAVWREIRKCLVQFLLSCKRKKKRDKNGLLSLYRLCYQVNVTFRVPYFKVRSLRRDVFLWLATADTFHKAKSDLNSLILSTFFIEGIFSSVPWFQTLKLTNIYKWQFVRSSCSATRTQMLCIPHFVEKTSENSPYASGIHQCKPIIILFIWVCFLFSP